MKQLGTFVLIGTLCMLCFIFLGSVDQSESYITTFQAADNSIGYQSTVSSHDNSIEETLFEIQDAILEKNASWTADFTSVFNPQVSLDDLGLGCIIEEEPEGYDDPLISSVLSTPISYDWRDVDGVDWTTPIRNQLSCGSCVAFGTIGALEGVIQIELGQQIDIDLSEAHLFYCGGGSCSSGWTVQKAVRQLEDVGVSLESCFPYTPRQTDCENVCPDWQEQAIQITDGRRILSSNNISAVQQALIDHGPLVTSYTVYKDFSAYTSGIYEHVYGEAVGGHAVAIVGYNNEEQYWICKNSWGKNWGEQGYFRIRFNECGLGSSFNTFYLSGVYGGFCDEYLPYELDDPLPASGAVNLPTSVTLEWTGGDPNPDDSVYYEIYFGATDEPAYIDTIGPFPAATKTISYTVNDLNVESVYYWQIISIDSNGARRVNPVLHFSTIDTNPPTVHVLSPQIGYMYKMNGDFRKQIPSSLAIIFGSLPIEFSVIENGSGLKQVDIYIDSRLKTSLTQEPFIWEWESLSFRKHTVTIVASDHAGNQNTQTVAVWKLF